MMSPVAKIFAVIRELTGTGQIRAGSTFSGVLLQAHVDLVAELEDIADALEGGWTSGHAVKRLRALARDLPPPDRPDLALVVDNARRVIDLGPLGGEVET